MCEGRNVGRHVDDLAQLGCLAQDLIYMIPLLQDSILLAAGIKEMSPTRRKRMQKRQIPAMHNNRPRLRWIQEFHLSHKAQEACSITRNSMVRPAGEVKLPNLSDLMVAFLGGKKQPVSSSTKETIHILLFFNHLPDFFNLMVHLKLTAFISISYAYLQNVKLENNDHMRF